MDTQTVIAMLALAVSVLTLLRSERHQRQQAPREVQRRAVDQLAHALWTLHAVIEHADVRQPPNAVVSDAMTVFERDWQRWQHQLPGGVRHRRRSAREAMACFFGPSAVVGLDPRAATTPLTALDRYWWDVGRSYLEHAHACVQRWLVADGHRDLNVLPYYQWRRDEDEAHFGPGIRAQPVGHRSAAHGVG